MSRYDMAAGSPCAAGARRSSRTRGHRTSPSRSRASATGFVTNRG